MERDAEPLEPTPAEADARLLAVVNASLDGMLVVDRDGRVQLVNTVAEELLGQAPHVLEGQLFGLPLMLGEAAEINLQRPGGGLRAVEMRTTPISWAGGPAQLIVLRDLSERRRAQEALRDAEGFSRAILNSLYQHIAVLDADGTIVLVNEAWRQFAIDNGDPELRGAGVGANYFAVCADATGDESQEAPQVLAGMRRVLCGELPCFELEYPCSSPTAERWFHMRVVPLHAQRPGLVITHTDITEQRRNARDAADAAALREQLQARERELYALGAISGARGAPPLRPGRALRAAEPAHFAALASQYAELLDAAVGSRGFTVPDHDAAARAIAARLGELRAAARDLVEIYLEALRRQSSGAALSRQQAYLEEGRVLALQVMGYLVAYYRERAAA